MSISISTRSIPGELSEKFSTLAKVGFTAIDLSEQDFVNFTGDVTEVASLANQHNLTIRTFQLANSKTHSLEELQQLFSACASLSVDEMLLNSATIEALSKGTATIAKDSRALVTVADIAQSNNIGIAYQAVPWAKRIKDDITAYQVISEINHPKLKLALNSSLSLAGGSNAASLRDIQGKHVSHVQLCDRLLRHQQPDSPATVGHLLPGQGSLNLASFMRLLAKNGYQGIWSLDSPLTDEARGTAEVIGQNSYRAILNLLDEAQRSEPALTVHITALPPRAYPSGFEFVEFAVDDEHAKILTDLLHTLGFRKEREHISKPVELWRQGAVNIVVNTSKTGFAADTFKHHGPAVCTMGLRVNDAEQTVERATLLGSPIFSQTVAENELSIPAIKGVGGNVVHFIDEKSDLHRMWNIDFNATRRTKATQPAGIRRIDHIAQTMRYEEMQHWLLYYISTFQMDKVPIVDVSDPSGIVRSQALASPEGEVRLNLNGASDNKTFAGSFVADKSGAGVQHIALLTDDIFETSALLALSGFERLEISANYYSQLSEKYALDQVLIDTLQAGNILYDVDDKTEYFQIYSKAIFNGFFFEVVQRRNGYSGYGAANASTRLASQTTVNHSKKSLKQGVS
jgi:4-hydroxyphenylpyruvate dioxygenase